MSVLTRLRILERFLHTSITSKIPQAKHLLVSTASGATQEAVEGCVAGLDFGSESEWPESTTFKMFPVS